MIALRRDLRERFRGGPHLVIVVEGRSDEARAERADEDRPGAPEKDRLGDRRHLGRAHALAHQRERLVGAPVGGPKVIGLVEIEVVDPGKIDERGDGQRLVAMRNDCFDLLRLDGDVFVFRHFIALDLIVPFDRLAGLSVNELAPNPVAGRPIDGVQGDALGGRSGGVKGDRDRHLRDLQEAFPACSRRQRQPREVPRAARAAKD